MSRILDIDADRWRIHIDHQPFRVRHHLVGNNLLDAQALARLANQLPAEAVEHNLGQLPTLHYAAPTARSAASAAEILSTPGFLGTWMAIKNIERVGVYRELLLDCLADVPDSKRPGNAPHNQQGFVFVSAHRSVTPTHYDAEQNFLLQIQGTKAITIGGWPDSASQQREMELKQQGGHRYLPFLPDQPQTFRLDPGDGVYVPPNSPHYVEVFDEPSISLSVTFRTTTSDIFDNAVFLNARLRRLGINPRPPGTNARVDQLKSLTTRALQRMMQWRR